MLEAQEVKHSDPLQLEPVDSIKTKEQIPQDENEIEKSRSSMYTAVNDIDTTRRISYWRITKRTGEIIPGNPDTLLTDFVNRLHADGMSVSMAYPGNLGLPMESRIYFDRQDRSNFMFADHYYNYAFTPEKHHFINTKIPYSNFTYHSAGSRETKEERLLGALSINFGKKLNFGFNVDYLYARGFYMSQAAKRLDWNFYGSYISDRHRLHLFINPTDYSNGENGGISNDLYITDPLSITNEKLQSRQIPVNYQRADGVQHTWNHQKGGEYYLNYHYNLGFEKDTDKKNEDGEVIKQFIPVSSIIYTFNYINKKRRFNATDSTTIDAFYNGRDAWGTGIAPNDSTSYMEMHNTLGLSMREGFSQWAQFDLTAFLSFERRNYTFMPDMITQKGHDSQNAIYIGGEIAKRTGKILRYEAYGRFGIVGDNLGDIDISGKIETRIPLFKDTASVSGRASIKNLSPTFYEKNFHSKYFWWDNMDFSKVNKIRFGGTIDFPQTKTNVSVDVENITNYIYFDEAGYVRQEPGSIQVLAVTLAQNLRLGILHWDNQLVYQTSSNQDIIPLPDLSAYSNLYLQFLVAKVLTIQLGGNAHYFSKYYSPIYEPTTQQFRLQKNTQVGNYPIISGYVNCHLKYTRFFIEFYNLSASFIDPPEYFSMPSYPLNPQMFKFGLSWDFHN
ncbi:MAG: putative porin [Dysgonamonadaceae bacterium]|jgi:hypothetical protein|nr:putative porin [Dysgonamonadaceae bacterium]